MICSTALARRISDGNQTIERNVFNIEGKNGIFCMLKRCLYSPYFLCICTIKKLCIILTYMYSNKSSRMKLTDGMHL